MKKCALEKDQHGYTPLGLAIQNRHFAAAEILLKFGADPFDNVENPYENPFCPYWLVLGTYFYQRKNLHSNSLKFAKTYNLI